MRTSWQVGPDQPLVLFIGRIVRGKGLFDLLEAMRSATLRNPALRCVLVGSVPGFDDTSALREKLQQDTSLEERVRILPSCDPAGIWELLCAADIFVFPSYAEGMPNSLLEAMAMGIASVAYAIPPVVELEGGSGGLVLVPTGDAARLSEAILRLAERPDERVRRGTEGRARVRSHFMVQQNLPEALRRLERLVHTSGEPTTREAVSPGRTDERGLSKEPS